MRLTPREQKIITQAIRALDQEAQIYLFGSRVDDHLKGGDIDLLVISETLDFADVLKLRRMILDQIGWQQLDLIIKKHSELKEPFVVEAIETGVEF
jgi:predicted nucleotidyltransferase